MFNKVILIGNLTKDPTTKTIANGTTVCNFDLAVNTRLTKDKEEVLFVRVVSWSKTAEFCGNYLKKGTAVIVEGRLVIRAYDDKEGNKKYITEINASSVNFLNVGKKKDTNKEEKVEGEELVEGGDNIPF